MQPRKGDIIAIAQEHSSTGVFGSGRGATRYTTFVLGYAESVSRQGVVTKYRVAAPADMPVMQVKYLSGRVLCITSFQAQARELLAKTNGTPTEWANADDLKNAIRTVRLGL